MKILYLIGIVKWEVGYTSLRFRDEVIGEDKYLRVIVICMIVSAKRQDEIKAVS